MTSGLAVGAQLVDDVFAGVGSVDVALVHRVERVLLASVPVLGQGVAVDVATGRAQLLDHFAHEADLFAQVLRVAQGVQGPIESSEGVLLVALVEPFGGLGHGLGELLVAGVAGEAFEVASELLGRGVVLPLGERLLGLALEPREGFGGLAEVVAREGASQGAGGVPRGAAAGGRVEGSDGVFELAKGLAQPPQAPQLLPAVRAPAAEGAFEGLEVREELAEFGTQRAASEFAPHGLHAGADLFGPRQALLLLDAPLLFAGRATEDVDGREHGEHHHRQGRRQRHPAQFARRAQADHPFRFQTADPLRRVVDERLLDVAPRCADAQGRGDALLEAEPTVDAHGRLEGGRPRPQRPQEPRAHGQADSGHGVEPGRDAEVDELVGQGDDDREDGHVEEALAHPFDQARQEEPAGHERDGAANLLHGSSRRNWLRV
ncbi:MAG: hypothetical protein D6731_20760 [Planctomycetota bacterium]|nr:MAG: hypothetical protein D6731_20760 [Planctomycetota bacterium]